MDGARQTERHAMSTDERVTKDIIETLEDGRKGFESAAERLREAGRNDVAAEFMRYSAQRREFATELENMAAVYGDDIDESGSVAAAVHRGWMAVKDMLSGDDVDGLLDAAEQGEDHAVTEYEKALGEEISDGLRAVLSRQFAEVQAAHQSVRSLRNATS